MAVSKSDEVGDPCHCGDKTTWHPECYTDEEDIVNLKTRCEKMESALKVIWTWAHCYSAKLQIDPLPMIFEQIEKRADEALKGRWKRLKSKREVKKSRKAVKTKINGG